MASLVVHLGIMPREYKQLTLREKSAIIAEANKRNRSKRK